jgi:hypothetical protein
MSAAASPFHGVIPILATPFKEDESLDLTSWERVVTFAIEQGVNGITLLGVLGEANGVGPLQRAGPKVLGRVAAVLAEKSGFAQFGRAMPLVAAPLTAWLNNHHIQVVGEAALRQYDGFQRAAAKTRTAPGASAP